MENSDIASFFYKIADYLSLASENPFKIRAYTRAAQVIENLPERISEIYKTWGISGVKKIPGIGESIALKIEEILKTGELKYLQKLKKKIPSGLQEMLQVPTLGPKTIQKFFLTFRVEGIEDLEKLAKSRKLRKIKGFGPKTEENILEGIKRLKKIGKRIPLGKAYFQAESIIEELKKNKNLDKISMAGSLRRMKETIGDLDILASSEKPEEIIKQFVSLSQVEKVKVKGPTKSEIILKNGMEADLRVVKPESFGSALHYFTGSKPHNIRIRTIGVERGLKINEYGVFKVSKKETRLRRGYGGQGRLGGEKEEDVFSSVGLPLIPPELREDAGEIEAGYQGRLPSLITLSDLKGDLHVHTKWSEGSHSIEDMANAALKENLKYIAVTDHSKTIGITKGVDEAKLEKQIKEIEKVDRKFRKLKILKGVETDLLASGSPDLKESSLKKLDLVVAAVHSRFRQTEEEMTKRILKAVENPIVKIIAHPTTRLINLREPVKADWEEIFKRAAKTKTIMEINCAWERLDLNDVLARRAKELGVKIAISTDSHNPFEYKLLRFGVATARRAWLEKEDVINTWELEKLLKFIRR